MRRVGLAGRSTCASTVFPWTVFCYSGLFCGIAHGGRLRDPGFQNASALGVAGEIVAFLLGHREVSVGFGDECFVLFFWRGLVAGFKFGPGNLLK
jgi:hypothetical protein